MKQKPNIYRCLCSSRDTVTQAIGLYAVMPIIVGTVWCGGGASQHSDYIDCGARNEIFVNDMFADPCSFFTDPDLDPTFLFSRIRNSFFSFKRITLINITFSFFILFTFTLHSRTLYSFSSDCFLLKSLYIDYFSWIHCKKYIYIPPVIRIHACHRNIVICFTMELKFCWVAGLESNSKFSVKKKKQIL